MTQLNNTPFAIMFNVGDERDLEDHSTIRGNLPDIREVFYTRDTKKIMIYGNVDPYIKEDFTTFPNESDMIALSMIFN